MTWLIILQVIPTIGIIAYLTFLGYYYAAPMIRLRVMMIVAFKKYHCKDVHISEEKIAVRFEKDGEECLIEHAVTEEPGSRFWVSDLCVILRGMLRSVKG